MLVLLAVLMMYGTDSLAAAAAEASSPFGLKIRCTPTGAGPLISQSVSD
jgi:hypothetical protein